MNATRTITDRDRAIIDGFAAAGLAYVHLPEDADRVKSLMGDTSERPARRLADMEQRNQVVRVAHGAYIFLPPGARTVRQAVDHRTLVAAGLEGRWRYYLGFAAAIAEHGLTDETVEELTIAVEGRSVPRFTELGGIPVRFARVAFDDDTKWLGLGRERIRGRTMYWLAGVERTLIDALDRPGLCLRPELWVRAWERALREKRVDIPLLLDLARRRSRAVAARASLLLREAGRPRDARLLLDRPVTGRVLFNADDPDPGGVPRDRETGLMLNVSLDAVVRWMNYGQ